MSTITPTQRQAIVDYLRDRNIPSGLGTKESACSIAAINLALSGDLTDTIPECMSLVIGRWVIVIQDAMPSDMRNSDQWRKLLPLAAGTGREKETERVAIILEWMWSKVLPTLMPIAEKHGFSDKWQTMLFEKTFTAADAAAWAADAAARVAADAAAARAAYTAAARAADAAARAADATLAAADAAAARAAARAVAWAADVTARAADVAARAADVAARAAAWAADAARAAADAADVAARAAARAAAWAAAWAIFDPCGLLERLVDVRD